MDVYPFNIINANGKMKITGNKVYDYKSHNFLFANLRKRQRVKNMPYNFDQPGFSNSAYISNSFIDLVGGKINTINTSNYVRVKLIAYNCLYHNSILYAFTDNQKGEDNLKFTVLFSNCNEHNIGDYWDISSNGKRYLILVLVSNGWNKDKTFISTRVVQFRIYNKS